MNGDEKRKVHLEITISQDDFLSTINENKSVAIRMVLDKYMKQQKGKDFERYLTSFGFGIVLVGVGSLLDNIFISITSIATGMVMIVFSLAMYTKGRITYEKKKEEV